MGFQGSIPSTPDQASVICINNATVSQYLWTIFSFIDEVYITRVVLSPNETWILLIFSFAELPFFKDCCHIFLLIGMKKFQRGESQESDVPVAKATKPILLCLDRNAHNKPVEAASISKCTCYQDTVVHIQM